MKSGFEKRHVRKVEEDSIKSYALYVCQEEWSFSVEDTKQIKSLDNIFQFYRSQDP